MGRAQTPTPVISGATAGILQALLSMEPGQQPAPREISEVAGRAVARGEITLDGRGELPTPDILYRALGSGDTIPIQLVSACETAPMVLTFRHTAKPGDLIVIEEPESHLGERDSASWPGP